MIKIKDGTLIEESSKNQKTEVKKKDQSKSVSSISKIHRPEVIDAKVYKLNSSFVQYSVFITLSYVKDNSGIRPMEIFINSFF